jgi:hypothetical protein
MSLNFNFQYLFDGYPPIIKDHTFYILAIVSIALIVLSVIFKDFLIKKPFFRKRIDRYQKALIIKFSDIALTWSIINLLLLFFRKLRVPYFQMRFLAILWTMIILVWLITAIQHYIVKVPKMREEDAKRKEYEKYIE